MGSTVTTTTKIKVAEMTDHPLFVTASLDPRGLLSESVGNNMGKQIASAYSGSTTYYPWVASFP